jgi:hypothetical protein
MLLHVLFACSNLQMQPLDRMAVILGEFGVPDHGKPKTPTTPSPAGGSNSNPADSAVAADDGDFSKIADVDITFLQDLAEYLRGLEVQGATVSWFWWAWNANSGWARAHSFYLYSYQIHGEV